MPSELFQLDVRRRPTKIVIILTLILATGWAYFALRWYLGNTLAEYFHADLDDVDMARLAVSLAPNDPLTHWRLGQIYQKRLPLDQQELVIAEYQKAVNLSPNDYRLWNALGTAYEQSGSTAKAEQALRQAVALAPAYALPHWYLGNLLLRDGRYDNAFAELRIASEAYAELRPQFFGNVLQIYGSDLQAMENAVGRSPGTRAEFAFYLLKQHGIQDGLSVWNNLSEEEKKQNRANGNSIVKTLIGERKVHEAVRVWNTLAPDPNYQVTTGRMFDGGFEAAVAHGPDMVFGWQVGSLAQLQMGIDPSESHSGFRSLRLIFQVRGKLDAIQVSELVPVDPATEYDFECYVKTRKLQTASPPYIQIFDASKGNVLATSEAAPNGDNDWTRIAFSFKTGDKTEAVQVRMGRDGCGEDQVCPIFGAVWYDDFSIKQRN